MSRIFFDFPSVGWRSLLVGEDKEFGRKVSDPKNPEKLVQVNGWQYGFDNCTTLMLSALERYGFTPKDVVIVLERGETTALRYRKTKDSEYKANRSKRPPEQYKEFSKMEEEVTSFWLDLGAAVAFQENVEADDVLAYLAAHTEEPAMVFSHDGDLVRLVGTNSKGVMVSVGNNDALNTNPYGPFPVEGITVYKALVGDTGDNIKGAHGFGDAAFLKMLAQYGVEVLEDLEKLIERRELEGLSNDAEDFKPFKKVVDDRASVYTSHTLAKLYPDAIDTVEKPLQWKYGMVRDWKENDDFRFRKWYGTRTLVHADNLEVALAEISKTRTPFVAIDLETTTCEESDRWLEEKRKKIDDDTGIDVFGQEIVSCGVTIGPNLNHTYYFTHRHLDEEGITQLTREQLRDAIAGICHKRRVVAHNAQGFEIPVLGMHFMEDWKDNGWGGLLPNVHCTKLLASYVNENIRSNLKFSAKKYLGYNQQTYAEVTGGKKMDQLTASHVFHYGTDDTIVTAALYNHWSFFCQTEDTWKVFCEVEPIPAYVTALAFIKGTNLNYQAIRDFARDDDKVYEEAWPTVRQYLIEAGWAGTLCPVMSSPITPAQVKQAFEMLTGKTLDTKVRKADKLVAVLKQELGEDSYEVTLFEAALEGDSTLLNVMLKSKFKGEPELNLGSPKQMCRLLYDEMGLQIRVRNKPTDAMRERGERVGSPSTNELAIKHAIHLDANDKIKKVLQAVLDMKSVETRRKLYYVPYMTVRHWKDGKIHSSFNQNAAATRRWSSSDPNLQQQPKKDEGLRFRESIIPHHEEAVVVSLDFEAQELRLTADDSGDENMLSCYIGDTPRDIHTMTGAGTAERVIGKQLTYQQLLEMLESSDEAVKEKGKELRALGKKINFTELYGAQAKKIALELMLEEADAQAFLEAKKQTFPGVELWRERIIGDLKEKGYATTKLGARRHLREQLHSSDFWIANKAERQGPNFRIQGSGAEMTKLAMKSMWKAGLFFKYDAVPIGPIHDEVVFSVARKDLYGFIPEVHRCMVQPYGGMRVPVGSSISFGPSFGQQIEIGNAPTTQAISSGLEKMDMRYNARKEAA